MFSFLGFVAPHLLCPDLSHFLQLRHRRRCSQRQPCRCKEGKGGGRGCQDCRRPQVSPKLMCLYHIMIVNCDPTISFDIARCFALPYLGGFVEVFSMFIHQSPSQFLLLPTRFNTSFLYFREFLFLNYVLPHFASVSSHPPLTFFHFESQFLPISITYSHFIYHTFFCLVCLASRILWQ